MPSIGGHTAKINAFEWSPFNDTIIGTASSDSTIKIH